MYILQAKDIEKSYSNHKALDKVSIDIPRGSIYGLLGPNGAGKTSLIRIITQITAPDSGSILIEGEPLKASDIAKIGYLPEERGLYKKMKVGEQVLYLAQLKGLNKKEALEKIKYWFKKFEITSWWEKRVDELSKGMQQKLQFIITVLHEPKLLIFDEPFSGFDPINVTLLKNEILELKAKGTTLIFSTHNMESVEELCDYITLIDKSKVTLQGNLNDIKQQYKENIFRIDFIGQPDIVKNILNSNNYNILSSETTNLQHSFIIKSNLEESHNNLLSLIIKEVQLISFNEILPRMNEIFIKSVQNK